MISVLRCECFADINRFVPRARLKSAPISDTQRHVLAPEVMSTVVMLMGQAASAYHTYEPSAGWGGLVMAESARGSDRDRETRHSVVVFQGVL